MSIIFATLLRFMLAKANRKLDRGATIGHDGIMTGDSRRVDVDKDGLPTEAAENGFRFLL